MLLTTHTHTHTNVPENLLDRPRFLPRGQTGQADKAKLLSIRLQLLVCKLAKSNNHKYKNVTTDSTFTQNY